MRGKCASKLLRSRDSLGKERRKGERKRGREWEARNDHVRSIEYDFRSAARLISQHRRESRPTLGENHPRGSRDANIRENRASVLFRGSLSSSRPLPLGHESLAAQSQVAHVHPPSATPSFPQFFPFLPRFTRSPSTAPITSTCFPLTFSHPFSRRGLYIYHLVTCSDVSSGADPEAFLRGGEMRESTYIREIVLEQF